ncbi:MAG: hypothetical protein GY794_25055 [bacterium]|nr:hypothetical protein [bacterium]
MNVNKVIIATVIIAVIGTTATLAYWYWPGGADISDAPPIEDRQEATKYIASEDFAKLDDKTRQTYVKKLAETMKDSRPRDFRATTQFSDEEKSRLRKQFQPVMRQMITNHINTYFELPPEKRNEHLDKTIDFIEARRPKNTNTTTRPKRSRRGMTPEGLKKILENTEPEQRAKFVAYIKAIEKRRKERGLPPAHGPR